MSSSTKKKARSNLCAPWPKEQEQILRAAVIKYGETAASQIAAALAKYGRSEAEIRGHWRATQPLIKGAWTKAEDDLLRYIVTKSGAKRWSKIAEHIPRRNAKQCRERWVNNLDSSVSKSAWTAAEDKVLTETQKKIGNRWSEIAKLLPGRPDNAVKNRWYSMMNRQKGTGKKKLPTTPTPSRRSTKKSRGSSLDSQLAGESPALGSPKTHRKTAADRSPTTKLSSPTTKLSSPEKSSPHGSTDAGLVADAGCGGRKRVSASLSGSQRDTQRSTYKTTSCGLMHPPRSSSASRGAKTDLAPSPQLYHDPVDAEVLRPSASMDSIDDPLLVSSAEAFGFYTDKPYDTAAPYQLSIPHAQLAAAAASKKSLRRSSQTSSPLFGEGEMLLEMEEVDAHYGIATQPLGAAAGGDVDMGLSMHLGGRGHLTHADLASISHSNAGCSSYKASSGLAHESPAFYDEFMVDTAMATDDLSGHVHGHGHHGLHGLSPLGSPTPSGFDDIDLAMDGGGMGMEPSAFGAMCPPSLAVPLAQRARR